jgi:hypothetical protein
MKKEFESLTAADFYEKLQHDKLDTIVPFSIIGMVKKSEIEEKAIQFASGGNCSNWITIPLEIIEEVVIIKTIPCKDHSHPLVKLNLKTPTTAEGIFLKNLLESMKYVNKNKQPNEAKPTSLQINSSIATKQLSDGFFGGGGLSAWGCWSSQCCVSGHYERDPNGGAWGPIYRWVCDAWEPCERCIWPW